MNVEKIKNFFSKVDLKGSQYERASTVNEYLEDTTNGKYVVIAGTNWNWSCYTDDGSFKFKNDGESFCVGKLTPHVKNDKQIKNFKQNVILAVDKAEKIGGTNEEKKKIFKEAFSDAVNIIVRGETAHSHFSYSWNCFHLEIRGDTIYEAWLYG